MGSVLKERRIGLGKDLKDVARETKVTKSYLTAIEEEDFSSLPAEVYTKGYIRGYAKFVGISLDVALAAYESYLEESKHAKEKLKTELTKSTSKKLNYLINKLITRKAFWIIISAVIISIVYLLLISQKEMPSMPPKIELPEMQKQMQIKSDKELAPTINEPNNELKDDDLLPTVPYSLVSQNIYSLEIIATDRVWVRVVIDKVETREVLLNPGERVNYEANESIEVLIGNAFGVKLKFNDTVLENLGDKGQVIRLNFP